LQYETKRVIAVKLVGSYYSPFVRRVAITLMSRNIAYEHEDLNAYAAPARARILNPVGRVPVLVLDGGECLIDSTAILDYIDELIGPAGALIPRSGPDRRAVLRLAAIATAIYEHSTARYFEELHPSWVGQLDLIERYRTHVIGGLEALDAAASPGGAIGATAPLSLATISAVVAFDYALSKHPDLNLSRIAPALSEVTASLAGEPAFGRPRPPSL
jgi:glutathione S-transferase